MTKQTLAALILALIAGSAHAKFQSALPAKCDARVEDLAINGSPLTYERARQLRSATLASNQTLRLSPVTLPTGREATIAIDRDGCARVVSVHGLR